VAERIAAVLRDEAADVCTVYDAAGGYGHPDHVQVHRAGRRAAELAGTPKVYDATINRDLMSAGVSLARDLGYDIPTEFLPEQLGDRAWYTPEAELTAAVDVTPFLAQKRAAMLAHHSQTTSTSDASRSLAVFASLPDDYFALAFGTEWFVRVGAPAGIAESDLFAGLVDA
jgi:LmbE family N-acetylglucosaminyl deacetylase